MLIDSLTTWDSAVLSSCTSMGNNRVIYFYVENFNIFDMHSINIASPSNTAPASNV